MNALHQGLLMAGRDLRHWQREPWMPIFGIAFSLMLLLVFGSGPGRSGVR